MQDGDQVAVGYMLCTLLVSDHRGHKHDGLEDQVVLSPRDEDVLDELKEVVIDEYGVPLVAGDVDQGADQLDHEVGVLATLLDQLNVHGHVLLVDVYVGHWAELGAVSDYSEEEGVKGFEGSVYHCLQLVVG